MEYFWQTYVDLINGWKLVTILILIAVDFILGVIVALKDGNFELAKIGQFLNTSVLYFLGGYLLLGLAAVAEPQFGETIVTGAFALLDATMIGFILNKVKALGIPIPEKLAFLNFNSSGSEDE